MLNNKLFHISQGTKGWLPTINSDLKIHALLTMGFVLTDGRLYPDEIPQIEAKLPRYYSVKDVTPYKKGILNHGDYCCRMIEISRLSLLDSYRKVQVNADSITDFIEKYGKETLFARRGKEHVDREVERLTMELAEKGYALIRARESKSGKLVAYLG